jgi:hypothetical protein
MAQKRKDKAKKRIVVVEQTGQVHIKASFNNIIISVTNNNGQVISWASAGKMGFKGSKKILLMLPKWLHLIALKLLTKQVCVKLKYL